MRLHELPRHLSAVVVVLSYFFPKSSSQPTITSSTHLTSSQTAVCDFKTINYITHTLPQQCLRTSWPGDQGAKNGTIYDAANYQENWPTDTGVSGQATLTSDASAEPMRSDLPTPTPYDTLSEEEPSPRPFMSFEDWKEMMLRKAGQDATELKTRKTHDRSTEHERVMKNSGLDSLGDDSEIDLNFDVVSEKISNIASAPHASPTRTTASEHQEPVLYDDGRTQYYRSKDAGKTCKERFSYSSFDAGATVLKTNRGAKNSKAILLENKDSYMLLECAAENKFVIVELSDDILVDTIVLANFEFFSSMIRQFRVSVSDRYPVKVDKWKDLGTFEAKNSRDIQPFLIPNPLIWAKYVRIEFLSHYGNEYYCPVSLLRVHGTRMLESLKDTEAPVDDEDAAEEPLGELPGPASETKTVNSSNKQASTSFETTVDFSHDVSLGISVDPSRPHNLFSPIDSNHSTCSKFTILLAAHIPEASTPTEAHGAASTESIRSSVQGSTGGGSPKAKFAESSTSSVASALTSQLEASVVPTAAFSASMAAHQSNAHVDPRSSVGEDTSAGSSSTKASPQGSPQARARGNSTTVPTSPTVQESFFKAVSKRLQYLESNVTLSLKYIEDQSRSLQETQHLAERKQLLRIDVFLDSLNDTVLSELRIVRQQYEQIWQSTVIALESQREQSQRETVALSSRLNILAEEVVFQKRMAIVQAILLLSCLVLVIFSRAMAQPILTSSFDVGRSSNLNHPLPGPPIDREPESSFITRYDKLGPPFHNVDCGDGDRSDTSPGPGLPSSAALGHMITPSPNVVRCGTEGAETSGLLADGHYVETETSTSYRSSSPNPAAHYPDEGGFKADQTSSVNCGYPIDDVDQSEEATSEVVLNSRFPPPTRGITTSSIRKPLPALPE